jgi:hypothetical protein
MELGTYPTYTDITYGPDGSKLALVNVQSGVHLR